MLPVPDHPAVIECRRSIGILEPSDALGQHDFFGKHRTVDEQMPSASRVVEVRAQEHCDYASVVKAQGAFDELPRQSTGLVMIALTPVSGACPRKSTPGVMSLPITSKPACWSASTLIPRNGRSRPVRCRTKSTKGQRCASQQNSCVNDSYGSKAEKLDLLGPRG